MKTISVISECENSDIIINQKTKDYGPITKLLG